MSCTGKDLDFADRMFEDDFFCGDVSVISEISKQLKSSKGFILYDGDCSLCCNAAQVCRRIFKGRFVCRSIQSSLELLPKDRRTVITEMFFVTPQEEVFGGAQAWVAIARRVWWLKPFAWFSLMPGAMTFLGWIYRYIAKRRYCISDACGFKPVQPADPVGTKTGRGMADSDVDWRSHRPVT